MAEMTLKMNAFEPLAMDEMMAVDGGRRVTVSDVEDISTALSFSTFVVGGLASVKAFGCAAGAAILAANPVFIGVAAVSTTVAFGCYLYGKYNR